MADNEDKPEIGDDNTIVSSTPSRSMGSRNTIWTAADANGSVSIPGGTAVGAGARADRTSVAVGSGALGGDLAQLSALLAQLQQVVGQTGDTETARVITEMAEEIQSPTRDESKIRRLWSMVKVAAVTNEAVTLVARITPLLLSSPHHH
jgi:hypothetical protein